jgi:hypothetical protein
MALITCPDCQREVSDAAPACIYCGRPLIAAPLATDSEVSLAERIASRTLGIRSLARDRAREGFARVQERAGEAGREAVDWARQQASAASDQGKELSERALSLVFEECVIPAFLLPTGPESADFVCRFDFDTVLAKLSSGVLVRPRIVAWVGNPDVDRERLATALADDFLLQLGEQREARLREADARRSDQLQVIQQATAQGSRGVAAGVRTATFGAIAMLIATNPIIDIALLAVTVFGGVSAAQGMLNLGGAALKKGRTEDELAGEKRRLRKDLDRSSQRLQKAVRKMEMRVHPVLHAVVLQMQELEGLLPAATDPTMGADPPDVRRLLSDPTYRANVADWFVPFVDVAS